MMAISGISFSPIRRLGRKAWILVFAASSLFLLQIPHYHAYAILPKTGGRDRRGRRPFFHRMSASSRHSSNNLIITGGADTDDLALERCCHPIDQDVLSLYRNNFHEKRSKRYVPSLPKSEESCSNDALYILRLPKNGIVVAALRLTRSKYNSEYSFLRSLCVSRDHRRQGLALRLLNESLHDFEAEHCYCFASPHLEGLYQQASFLRIPKGDMNDRSDLVPKWLIQSYRSMDERWSRKTLGLFLRRKPTQHDRQQSRWQ